LTKFLLNWLKNFLEKEKNLYEVFSLKSTRDISRKVSNLLTILPGEKLSTDQSDRQVLLDYLRELLSGMPSKLVIAVLSQLRWFWKST